MKIDYSTLSGIVPEDRRCGLPTRTMLGIVHRVYCGPMTARGYCTAACENCQDALLSAFTLQVAAKPAALLTWRLRNELARVQETQSVHTEIKTRDALGLPVSEGNPFEALRRQLEKPAQER